MGLESGDFCDAVTVLYQVNYQANLQFKLLLCRSTLGKLVDMDIPRIYV